MKLSTAVLLIAMLSASVMASSQTVTLSAKNVSLKTVLLAVQKQTGYTYWANKELLQSACCLNVHAENMPLEQFLTLALKGTRIKARIEEGTIVLSQQKTAPSPLSLLIAPDTIPAQVITGVVQLKDGLGAPTPLAGATVSEKGVNGNATATNERGEFRIKVRTGATLIITHVSIEPYAVRLSDNQTSVKAEVNLKESLAGKDVVVTGYFTRKKETFTGASTTITRKELQKFNNNNIFSIIQTLDPAFRVQENNIAGSDPNRLPDINIRGISSVGSNVNLPLIIIDGFQGTLQQLYDMDVNRIESISILKDASATILYGSRAGNGVLVIETRLPKSGKFTVSYDFKGSATLVDLSDYNLMNASQKLEYEKLAGIYQYKDPADPQWTADYTMKLNNLYRDRQLAVQSGVNTYWLKQPVQSTFSTGHSIRAEGGNQEVRYSIDGNYADFKGAMKGSGRTRYGAAFNLIYRIPNKVTFRNNASFQGTKEYNSPYGSFSLYTKMNPYERIYDDNGKLIPRYNDLGQYFTSFAGGVSYNPLYNASLPYKNFNNSSILTNNLSIEWFIGSGFKLNAVGVLSKTFNDGELYISPYNTRFISESSDTRKGLYAVNNGGATQYQANLTLQYGKTLGLHSLNAAVIGEARSSKIDGRSDTLRGFVDDRFVSPSLALGYSSMRPTYTSVPERLLGLASNLHYDYDQKYLADFSYRVDGSSKFGEDNRFGSFWSVGLGYNLHKEKFFHVNGVDMFRVFANLGETGNENFTADMTTTAYLFSPDARYYKKNTTMYVSQGNPSLTWPKIFQKSAGIDAAFWNQRINVRLNVYERTTNRMISAITVAPSLGFADNRFYENLGEVRNRGFELSSTVMVYSNPQKQLYWSLNFAAVKNQSKLVKISDELKKLNESLVAKESNGDIKRISAYYEENQSLSVFRAVRSLGIDPATGRELYLDLNGNRTYTWNAQNQIVAGDKEPRLSGTFGTDLSWKGLSVRLFFYYTLGADIYNTTLVDKVENASPYMNADLRILEQRWKTPGDVAMYKGISDQTATQLTTRFVQKENTLRLASLNVNYDFMKVKLAKYRIQRLRLNFSTNDVFRLSTIRMERGIDYPFARTYNLGLTVEY
ncbi:SusC/RagA family TonB-linked outer membrane protein [Pseudoflavitalea sp. G-6-1-2]|uniref:SusC/RagA family TonB-linked outer membrane protein n=1 Tax=Pseudoflavitalea sp. G-6-1-2 TaxID=2728841 RepID=UPI00146CC752|nr:SusC/RagA family TonB-linked outer membrane protein [Pseudoflavitalea sp. G-6-1-2]NML23559.1 SusC/RagA family TonB-linked outer membrane protein [Pseudoflavitalea sp. G-6-1-2]